MLQLCAGWAVLGITAISPEKTTRFELIMLFRKCLEGGLMHLFINEGDLYSLLKFTNVMFLLMLLYLHQALKEVSQLL